LFHYQATLDLLGQNPNSNTDLRTGLKALVRFGLPPERYWPYDVQSLHTQPGPHLYGYAESFRAIQYVRLDGRGSTGRETLERVKSFLAASIPVAFGLPVPSSCKVSGDFLYRPEMECPEGGQSLIAVGYDDDKLTATKGALLVRNSWGLDWGDQGHAWLSYEFVLEQQTADFWTILRPDWIESGELFRPVSVG
jgi:C1A family cysteine protease